MVPWPTQYLHLKVKTDTLDGLKSMKIRVPDKNAQDMCAAVGMAPVLIPWGETIPALASGAVAGVSTSSVSGVDGKFWEFLKYVYPTNHTWSCQMVNVNLDSWKALERRSADRRRRTLPQEDGAGFWAEFAQGGRRQPQPAQGRRHGGGAGLGGHDHGHSAPRPRRSLTLSSSACRRPTSRCGPISPK